MRVSFMLKILKKNAMKENKRMSFAKLQLECIGSQS